MKFMVQANTHMAEYEKYIALYNKYKKDAKCAIPVPIVKSIITTTTNYKLVILKQPIGVVPVVISSNNNNKININVLPSLIS